MKKMTTKNLVFIAMIAALYTALCVALAPLSFGVLQMRVAEALTLLPIFSPIGVWGVTLGCALSNLVGLFTGTNPLWYMDVLFGTAATLVAAILSRQLRHIRFWGVPVLSALPPVLINAVVIGWELAIITAGDSQSFATAFLVNALSVAGGQMLSCFALGLPLVALLERTGAAALCFGPQDLGGRSTKMVLENK